MSTAITVIFTVLYFSVTIFLLRGFKINTRQMCLCGIAIALTVILEYIRIPLPTGATMPLGSMIPLMLTAIVCGYRITFIGGWICGILCMLLIPGWMPVHWGQFFVEHMICFSCLGYAGIFGSNNRAKILCGIILASLIRFCGHLLSGVVFFSQNAWDGWGAWGYSFGYNVSQNLPLCIISGVAVFAMPLKILKKIAGGEKVK